MPLSTYSPLGYLDTWLTDTSYQFFSAWVVISVIWLWCTLLVVGFYPIIDGRDQFKAVYRFFNNVRRGQQKDSPGEGSSSDGSREGVAAYVQEPKWEA